MAIRKIIVSSCKECPYLRHPWQALISSNRWACGNSFTGKDRPTDEKYWLGGDALPGDRIIRDQDIIQPWCRLKLL